MNKNIFKIISHQKQKWTQNVAKNKEKAFANEQQHRC